MSTPKLTPHGTTPNHFYRDPETKLILPLGVDVRQMLAMIHDLEQALGKENVLIDTSEGEKAGEGLFQNEQDAGLFTDGHDVQPGEDKFASSVSVTPNSTEQVQTIVKLANKHGVPISPISRGKNLGYGGRAPRLSGTIIVDLGTRMNKILEINTESCYCVVEPGVSYFELHEELVKRDLRKDLWIDCPDLGWGSVLGNLMDRGVGYTPYGDHFGNHVSMEIVLPNGEVFHTGMGAMGKDNASRYLFQYGYGPYVDGMFTQSNYGICTSVGVWLMPNPGGYRSYLWTFEKESDLPQIVELMRPLRIAGVFGHVAQLRHSLVDIACLGDKAYYFPEKSAKDNLTEAEFVNFIKTKFKNQGYWNFYGAVYGPKEIQDCQLKIIESQFSKVPGTKCYFVEDLVEPSLLHHRDVTMQGIPNNAELKWLDWRGKGYAHLFFAPISPSKGVDAVKQFEMCRSLCEEYDFQYMGNFCIGAREMHHILDLIYDPNDPGEKSRAQHLFRRLVKESAELGYGEYRTHLFLFDQVAATFGANNQIQLRFQEAIKDCVDPNGILAPGKSGIWPKRYRDVPGIRLGVAPEDAPKGGLWPETKPARM